VVEQAVSRTEVEVKEGEMDLSGGEGDLLTAYLAPYLALAGDARTRRLLGATVGGIIGAESLCVTRIAAFSPVAAKPASR
jgi:hypothetical protein